MPFTDAELEEMRRAGAEIERDFRLTPEDLAASRKRDRRARLEALPPEKQRQAASRRAYYEANREKVAASQRWIRDARIARGYTQRDLAQMLGVSYQIISHLETGRMRLDAFAKADKLREILGDEKGPAR